MRKTTTIIITVIVIALIGIIYWKYYFVFAQGTKAGVLNTFQEKGVMFKTYEGKLIQSGFQGGSAAAIQSNEFSFSVTDEHVAKKLMENSGADVELHYKLYNGSLPWRGMQLFIVDSIYRISGRNNTGNAVTPQ